MRDYDLCPTYKIIVKYHDGKWKTFSDVYSGYDLYEAIEKCQRENAYEFEHKYARIDAIYKETDDCWIEVDW